MDNTEWGFHFLGGQAWSMLTQNKVGITARQENIPLTIDPNYVVGFDFTRNWQLRVVKDFGSWAAFGLSIENPAELVYSSTGAVANGGNVGGWLVNFANAGNSFLGSSAFANNFAPDVAPDIISKVAFDPGWGHYELFGIARFFNDNTFGCVVSPAHRRDRLGGPPGPDSRAYVPRSPPTPWSPASKAKGTKSGDGIGGSVQLPFTKYVDVVASTMYGSGIGRYGSSLLPDVVVAPDGSLSPIKALHGLGGVVFAPLGRARHLRLCWYGKGAAQLAGASSPPAPLKV